MTSIRIPRLPATVPDAYRQRCEAAARAGPVSCGVPCRPRILVSAT